MKLVAAALLLAATTDAAVQGRRGTSGPPYIRSDQTNIQYEINDQTRVRPGT